MSFCVYVETPPPPILSTRKANTKPLPTKTTTLGPFECMSSFTFPEFLDIIATALMVKALIDRRKDYVFSIFMAPPSFVKVELPWKESGDEGPKVPLNFEYGIDDLHGGGSVLSIRDQLAGIDKSSSAELNELLEAYPINNDPLFPGKRIFHNATGYFDLTDIRLCVWAVAKLLLANPNVLQNAIQMMNPYHHAVPYGYMHQPYPPAPLYPHPHGGMPAPAPLPPAPQAAEAAAIELPREISLDEYCERYKVNPEDRRVLTEIGYIPGDNGIKDLDVDAWATTKVLALAKARILRQHTAFLKDVANGLWD
ncbi:hypothetical protein B0H14DRAFT_3447395 [Mycena olivaceomarginata]|nr:hypothetical protein B0H14DRAFT_3447395 [Mycena olivaceomarginata]